MTAKKWVKLKNHFNEPENNHLVAKKKQLRQPKKNRVGDTKKNFIGVEENLIGVKKIHLG